MSLFFPRGVAAVGVPFPPLKDKSTGDPLNSAATAEVSKDGAAFGAVDNAAYVRGTDGSWFIDPSADEMDAKTITYKLTHASGLSVQVAIITDAELGPGAKQVTVSFGSIASIADIWVTTQADTSTVVASGSADSSGDIVLYLDPGSYYIYGQKTGINFNNPNALVVTAAATQTASFTPTAAASPLDVSAYASIATAQDYFDQRLNTDAWNDASSTDKNKALIMATRAIDQLNFQGVATDAAIALGNQFPRGEDTSVPLGIVHATCEEALSLLDGLDVDEELEKLRTQSERMSGVSTSYNINFLPAHTRSGITSVRAWGYLKPYLRDRRGIRVRRVS
jgi:hypothetical protein